MVLPFLAATTINAMETIQKAPSSIQREKAEAFLQEYAEKRAALVKQRDDLRQTHSYSALTQATVVEKQIADLAKEYEKKAGLPDYIDLDSYWRWKPTRAERRAALIQILNSYKNSYKKYQEESPAATQAGFGYKIAESLRQLRYNLGNVTGLKDLGYLTDVDVEKLADEYAI